MYYRQPSTNLYNNHEEIWPMNPLAEEWFLSHSSTSSFDEHHDLSKDRPSPTPSSSSSSSNSANSSSSFDLPTTTTIATTTTSMLIKPKGIRCATCKRRFHSKGNLMNHHQLYQH
ncbi:hypothetical protein BDA99DRAFT_555498 [Phascolomyces articulosus]|uniref:C2H2-type domain-containing protein n=1 Tax=Phascolomyces articulosus TaxID=60185 RepID=A0AAD5KA58_9FUNG|nr:hypothetical protein BDA99DRAFT_555498 [Phascolomyces articulosus]